MGPSVFEILPNDCLPLLLEIGHKLNDLLGSQPKKANSPRPWTHFEQFNESPFYFYHEMIGNYRTEIHVMWGERVQQCEVLIGRIDPLSSTLEIMKRRASNAKDQAVYKQHVASHDFSNLHASILIRRERIFELHRPMMRHYFALRNAGEEPCLFIMKGSVSYKHVAMHALVASFKIFV